jgi:hypothetical protein
MPKASEGLSAKLTALEAENTGLRADLATATARLHGGVEVIAEPAAKPRRTKTMGKH